MIGKYSDEMTFDYIMNRMLESVPDTVDKREGSIIYDAREILSIRFFLFLR